MGPAQGVGTPDDSEQASEGCLDHLCPKACTESCLNTEDWLGYETLVDLGGLKICFYGCSVSGFDVELVGTQAVVSNADTGPYFRSIES